LDNLQVKPIGVYGSKEEIVRLLFSIGAVNDEMLVLFPNWNFFISSSISYSATALCLTKTSSSQPTLRSGLYIVRSLGKTAQEEQIYVVYWPEETTWNDNANSSIGRTRVTFMR